MVISVTITVNLNHTAWCGSLTTLIYVWTDVIIYRSSDVGQREQEKSRLEKLYQESDRRLDNLIQGAEQFVSICLSLLTVCSSGCLSSGGFGIESEERLYLRPPTQNVVGEHCPWHFSKFICEICEF